MLTLMEKAKDLGRELRKTEEYKKLEEVNLRLKEDNDAQQLLRSFQEAQQSIQFSQQTGIQPSQEQIADFESKRENLESNLTILAFMKAHEDFSAVMKQINEAIAAGVEEKAE